MNRPTPPADPHRYRVRIDGHLDPHWSEWFGDLTVTGQADGTTTLSGMLADQAELHGVLTKLRDLGLPLLAVQRLQDAGAERDG